MGSRRGRRLVVAALAAVGLLGAVHGCGEPLARAPKISDSRACGGSNVPLSEALDHFGFVLPEDARDLRFASDVHPLFGTYDLDMTFLTSPAGQQQFMNASHLPDLARPQYSKLVVSGPCTGPDGVDPDVADMSGGSYRSAVFQSNSQGVQVTVSAMDP
ncbi:MAG: hypothetical protein HYR62_03825 [Actinobacteria bacterium]|nr:hypothetical protein [Actinomycetota bacterium]